MSADEGKAAPVQQVVDELGFTAFHARVLALVAGVILLDGFDIQLAAFAAPAILADWNIGSAALAPVMAASLLGMAVGTSVGGRIGDRYGRRAALIGAALLICPLLSGPKLMIIWTTKEIMNAEQEASPGRDYRQAA